MIELPEEGEEVPEIPSLRNNLVASGDFDFCDYAYNVGILESGDPPLSVAVVAVTIIGAKVLVVLPEGAWARKLADRRLPTGALKRPTAIKVTSVALHSREEPSPEADLRVWVGLLDPTLEGAVEFGGEAADVDFPGEADLRRLPYAPALLAVCQDHFEFTTAESQGPTMAAPPGLDPAGDGIEARLEALEVMLGELRHVVAAGKTPTASQPMRATPKPAGRPPALRPPKAQRQETEELPGNLDAAVAQQALQAGVSVKVLNEVAGVVGNKMNPQSGRAQARAAPPVESSDEEAEDAGGSGAVGGGDAIQSAVLQLTKLVSHLSEEKIRAKDKGLESLLDKAEGGGSTKDSVSYSRSRAAALRTLQRTLKVNPKLIYESLEQRLCEDWEDAGLVPGITAGSVTARGWMEHRSRIQAFPASIRAGWALAGVWDCLRQNRVEEARARTGLALAALDQQACDRGSYLLAAEVSLEAPPPYSSFNSHQSPEAWDVPHSKLLDSRWVELMMHRLKDLSEYQERRLKLSGARKQEENLEKDPKPKAAPKMKGKGKGKEKDGSKGERPPEPAS